MIRKEKEEEEEPSFIMGGIEEAPSLQCFALLVEKGMNINTNSVKKKSQ
jgi:hypothetical protein